MYFLKSLGLALGISILTMGCASSALRDETVVDTTEDDLSLRAQLAGNYVASAPSSGALATLTLRPNGEFTANQVASTGSVTLEGNFYLRRLPGSALRLTLAPQGSAARQVFTAALQGRTLTLSSANTSQTLSNVACQSHAECGAKARCNFNGLAYFYCEVNDPSCSSGVCEPVVQNCQNDSECGANERCNLDGLAYFYCTDGDPKCQGVCEPRASTPTNQCTGAWPDPATGACKGLADQILPAECCTL